MAKGFTVKAKAPAKPKAAEQEWDYDKAREMLKGKTVVFCLPGRGVSYVYLKNFVLTFLKIIMEMKLIQPILTPIKLSMSIELFILLQRQWQWKKLIKISFN